jgi:hypothetical protein
MLKPLASSLVVCVLASCTTDVHDVSLATTASALEGDGKLVFELTDRELYGHYESPVGEVTLTALVESEHRLSATAVVNGVPIDIWASIEGEPEVGFQVKGGILDEKAHVLLDGVHLALADRFPYPQEGDKLDPTPPHVQLLRTYLGFLSEAPINVGEEAYRTMIIGPPPVDVVSHPPVVTTLPADPLTICDVPDDDGVTLLPQCCGGGTIVAFDHDFMPGGHCFETNHEWCGTNAASMGGALATDCPGRCGSKCNSFPGYYQDCLDHDLCLQHDAPGYHGVLPEACGDEWWDADDDIAISLAHWSMLFWPYWSWLGQPTPPVACS